MPNITTNHAITHTYYYYHNYYYEGCKDSSCYCHLKAYWFKCSSPSEPCPARTMTTRVSLFLTQFHTSQRCGSVERSDKVRLKLHFFPLSFFTYMYLLFRTSQRYGRMEQSDSLDIVTLFPLVMNPSSFQLYLFPHFSDVQSCG